MSWPRRPSSRTTNPEHRHGPSEETTTNITKAQPAIRTGFSWTREEHQEFRLDRLVLMTPRMLESRMSPTEDGSTHRRY